MAPQRVCKTPFELETQLRQYLGQGPDHARIDRFRRAFDNFRRALNNHERPDLTPLLKLFGFLFFGVAWRRVVVGWDDRLWGWERSYGLTRKNQNGVTCIWLDPRPFQSRRERRLFACEADSILSTLLHECVHAFLRTETCSPACRVNDECEAVWDAQVGRGAHGPAFLRIAALVERFARQHDLWSCDLDLRHMAQVYYDQTRKLIDSETVRRAFPRLRVQLSGRRVQFY